jgi:hypothetical protein
MSRPVFLTQEDAISYATGRACFRFGGIRVLDCDGAIAHIIPFNQTDRNIVIRNMPGAAVSPRLLGQPFRVHSNVALKLLSTDM